jgi:threonyl-tRNA synthetase
LDIFQFASHEHQSSSAILLASTASDYVPALTPIQGISYATGFYYDFLCDQAFDKTILTLITEEMRRKIQQNQSFETITMMPKNAASFIESKQPIQSAFLEDIDSNLVDLVKCGHFYDIAENEPVNDVRELREFLLYDIEKKEAFYEPLGDVSIVRIWGVCFSDRKSAKNFVKALHEAEKLDTVRAATQKELVRFYPEFVGAALWMPKGVAFSQKVRDFWRKLCQQQSIEEVMTLEEDIVKAHRLLINETKQRPFRIGEWTTQKVELFPQDCEGLFNTKNCQTDRITRAVTIDQLEDEIISSLQFMQELLRMLGLDFRYVLVLSGNRQHAQMQDKITGAFSRMGVDFAKEEKKIQKIRLELRASDRRAREWTLATLEVARLEGIVLLTQTSVVSVERVLALLLETGGSINS